MTSTDELDVMSTELVPTEASTELAVGEGQESAFDIELDDGPERTPIVATVITPAVEKRPIIPAHLRTVQGVKVSAKNAAAITGSRVGYHAVRSPWYVAQSVFWAAYAALWKIPAHQLRWWWHPELFPLLQFAASANDTEAGMKLHTALSKARSARAYWLLARAGGLVLGLVLLFFVAPWWAPWVAAPVGVAILARIGKPAHKTIFSAAVVTPRLRRLNLDIVARAYYSAGLAHPEKPDKQVTFGGNMARDALNAGSQVIVDLPYGTTFSDAVKVREKLASGLDVSMQQVYLTRDKTSNRRHLLWVADVDPLSIPAGRTPLLDCKPRDIWAKVPLGVDERGQRVQLPLMWTSVLFGAQPRKGKTFTARSLALYAALDPYVRLSVFDGKGSPDWRNFAMVAHTYGFGVLPDRVQGDPIENLLTTLRNMKLEVLNRNNRMSEMPTSVCPEGKLTREIARNPSYDMPVWVIILDEFQDYLNTGDPDVDLEISDLLLRLVKTGPSAGIIVISSTQKPSGLGSTGKVAKQFTDYRDQHQTRFALKVGSWQTSDCILGTGAAAEGCDASALPTGDDYRGVGILYDAPIANGNATVRTYLADGEDALKILTAAKRLRERAGTLDGMAAGQQLVVEARDPLADALDAFAGETFLAWPTLAARLAEQLPDRYAGMTPGSVQKLLCGLPGIESKNGRDPIVGLDKVVRGVTLAALNRAMEDRKAGRV